MPNSPQTILQNNRDWAEEVRRKEPQYFKRMEGSQSPNFIWIGCSDSRVPANMVTGLTPGELFVHRNIANQVIHSDMNCLSVLQYGVDVLKAKHIIVCGHYGCGGVAACTHDQTNGLVDNWILHINDTREKHSHLLEGLKDRQAELNRLCDLNVVEQVRNVCNTTVVRGAWSRHQELSVHGWIYEVTDGIIKELQGPIANIERIEPAYQEALARFKEDQG